MGGQGRGILGRRLRVVAAGVSPPRLPLRAIDRLVHVLLELLILAEGSDPHRLRLRVAGRRRGGVGGDEDDHAGSARGKGVTALPEERERELHSPWKARRREMVWRASQ